MRLTRLTLSNFQGIKNFEIIPEGKDLDISGANGTGKTTIANALSWLLTGKPSTDEKNYSPKSKDSDGDDIHGLNHVAEAVFDLEDGESLSLKKDYHEESVGKKTRSSKNNVQKTQNGPESNVTDYYIDGVKVLQQDYNEKLASLFSPEQALMLTLPHYFSEKMRWQDRRDILTSIAGTVSDDEVFKAYSELAPLSAKLADPATGKMKDVEEYRAWLLEAVKVNSKELQTIQPRIDEAEKAKPDLEGKDKAASEKRIAELKRKRDELAVRKDSLNSDDALVKNREALAKLEAQKAEMTEALAKAAEDANAEARKDIAGLDEKMAGLSAEVSSQRIGIAKAKRAHAEAEAEIREMELKLDRMKAVRDQAEKELKALEDEAYQPLVKPANSDICPCCGQRLPEHMLKEADEKYLKAEAERKAAFDADIDKRKAGIIAKGKANSRELIQQLDDEIGKKKEELDNSEQSIHDGEHALQIMERDLADLENRQKGLKNRLVKAMPVESTPEGKAVIERIAEIRKAIDEGENVVESASKAIDAEIAAIDAETNEEEAVVHGFAVTAQQEKRILELQQQEKDLKDMLKEMDEMLKLTERFTELRAEMFSRNINQHFTTVRFVLFEKQINGGIRETCEARVRSASGWMDWSSASSAEKINGGLEIINVLSDHYGIHLPIVVDNAEAVCSLATTQSQQIRLRVDEKDTVLRVETSTPAPSLKVGA